jgi:hypothetical protein
MKENSLLKKFISCCVAGLACVSLLLELGNSGTIPWFPPVLVFSLVGISFLASLIYPFIWHYRENKNTDNTVKVYGFLYSFIRCATAINLAIFGWKKIFNLQFNVPDSISNLPMNQQTGEWLTWFYFGHSRSFVLILAFIQIAGAWFLLFRRTVLLASVAIFAFMLNLLLINIFYNMNLGALMQSILVTIDICFLILLEYNRLVAFFIRTKPALPSLAFKNIWQNNITRIIVIVFSLLYVLYTKSIL